MSNRITLGAELDEDGLNILAGYRVNLGTGDRVVGDPVLEYATLADFVSRPR